MWYRHTMMEDLPSAGVAKAKIWASFGLSLFWVLFCWGFWTRFVGALGVNAFVYTLALTLFFLWLLYKEGRYQRHDLSWIIPLLLISLSFALYNNPFFKVFTLLVFPLVLAIFYNYAFITNKLQSFWNMIMIGRIVERMFSPLVYVGSAISSLFGAITWRGANKGAMVRRIALGGGILLVALLVILPLLSSADADFAAKLGGLSEFLRDIFSSSFIAKIIVLIVFSVVTIAMAIGWSRSIESVEAGEEKHVDALVASIVLVGILVFYAIFIWVQLDRLWVGALPFEFAETESLVKSGFWQLLFLSFLNLAIFFGVYRKTSATAQRVLSVFTVASFLLLISAGQRMILYVTNYGFSYEKFYALYAVLFCAILFLWLFSRLFVPERSNVLKFVAFQFLWMFALVSVFPVEQFIVSTNLKLVRRSSSQIRLFEMTMLSPDVLSRIRRDHARGLLVEKNGYLDRESEGDANELFDWQPWITQQTKRIADKKWYERTLSDMLN